MLPYTCILDSSGGCGHFINDINEVVSNWMTIEVGLEQHKSYKTPQWTPHIRKWHVTLNLDPLQPADWAVHMPFLVYSSETDNSLRIFFIWKIGQHWKWIKHRLTIRQGQRSEQQYSQNPRNQHITPSHDVTVSQKTWMRKIYHKGLLSYSKYALNYHC